MLEPKLCIRRRAIEEAHRFSLGETTPREGDVSFMAACQVSEITEVEDKAHPHLSCIIIYRYNWELYNKHQQDEQCERQSSIM